jgi:cytochrome P450
MTPVPGPRGRFLVGVLPEFRRDPAGFLLRTARDYGPLSAFRLGQQQTYLVNHPDLIREVLQTQARRFVKSKSTERIKVVLGEGLLTSEGEFHLRQRRLAQPAFYQPRLASYAAVMSEEAERACAGWRPGQSVSVDQTMMALTLRIVTRTLFSAQLEEDHAEVGEAVTGLLKLFPLLVLPFSEYLHRIPILPVSRQMLAARARLDAIVYRIIRERRASGESGNDLLGMLLAARDEEDGQTMSDRQVRDEVLTLFLAGHETTAVALTWTWWLLSLHPETERRLHAELDQVLGGRPPALADYAELRFTEQVLAESMRLFPPAWAMGRRAIEPVELGGHRLPANSVCIVSPYVLHRTPEYWPEPERFNPDRFRPEAREARHRLAYLPFGAGPRICIGERFAWMEGVLALATIARKWRLASTGEKPLVPEPLITLRPRGGFTATVIPRS